MFFFVFDHIKKKNVCQLLLKQSFPHRNLCLLEQILQVHGINWVIVLTLSVFYKPFEVCVLDDAGVSTFSVSSSSCSSLICPTIWVSVSVFVVGVWFNLLPDTCKPSLAESLSPIDDTLGAVLLPWSHPQWIPWIPLLLSLALSQQLAMVLIDTAAGSPWQITGILDDKLLQRVCNSKRRFYHFQDKLLGSFGDLNDACITMLNFAGCILK